MTDICCIGHITKDRIITPEKTVYMAGGTSFYFAYAFRNLPDKVSFRLVTKLNPEDKKAVTDMQSQGIDVLMYPSRETVFFENKYGANQNERTQRVLAKADAFTIEETEGIDARIYHLGSLLADDFSPELVKHLSKKGRISIDAQGYLRKVVDQQVLPTDWDDKLEILSMTDLLKVNEYEMEVITKLKDPYAAAHQLAEWGVREVIVTLGSEGSIIYAEGRFYDIPSYPPCRIADATGCGDTYAAGYIYQRCLGKSYDEAGRFAAAMCTLKLEHSGPFDRTIEEVEAILKA